jgi:signal transduction histidine kinase
MASAARAGSTPGGRSGIIQSRSIPGVRWNREPNVHARAGLGCMSDRPFMETRWMYGVEEGQAFRGWRVLVVDDSRAIRIYLRHILEAQGARVDEAGSAQAALDRVLGGEGLDLLLLDMVLPDTDGTEVLARIRERSDELPVVMITGAGGLRSATEAVLGGADGYIEKQHLSGDEDQSAFVHALRQAVEHRAGIVAQRQLQATKTEFYSMVTHDLRNPAGNVWGIVRMLLSGKAGPLTERQEQLLRIAESSSTKLVGLINDYLDFAKIEAGYLRLDPRPAELRDLVRAAAREAEPQAAVRHQRLDVRLPEGDVHAEVDAEKLGQVLENLVSNAIKYTPEGGSITVALDVDGGDAVFRVSDTGVGIAADQIPALFGRFHRVPGETARTIRGTGLGLLIVKEIVEAHGGQVHAESEGVAGRGTTFVVRIPLRSAEALPAGAAA